MWSSLVQAFDPGRRSDDESGAECVARLRRGDPEALSRLLEVYWHPLVSYASHLADGRFDAAEDLVQEAFVRLWERRASWEEGSLPAPILYTIVRNLALKESRTRSTRRLILRHFPFRSTAGTTPEDELEQRELDAALQSAVDALPPRRREIFVLARFHGLSYAEIADLTSVAPQTVANQMSAALTALRGSLRSFFRDPGAQP